MISFTGLKSFKGKVFLDIGCGSGLYSLTAFQLGAKKIISFDIDPFSIKCTEYLHKQAGSPKKWKIYSGSILEKNFIKKLGKFDMVYSWGVLHHTGKMWQAIKLSSELVKKNGYLYIAIYNKTEGWGIWTDGRFGPSKFWICEKKIYSHLPLFIQNIIDYSVMTLLIFLYLVTLKNPIKKMKEHKKFRGMAWRTDIKDWLGGYPYDYASPDEIFKFCKNLGFSLENLKTNFSLMNNEYLFKKVK